MIDYLSVADRMWPVLRRLMGAHAAVYRVTAGRVGERLPGLPGVLLLDHVGRKSGKRRITPLVYMPDGDDLVVVASKGGYPEHPARLLNIRAHPDTTVQIGSRRLNVRAEEADTQERRRIWPKAIAHNPHWNRHRERTSREIPIVVLRPRA